jgi:hypothetical protein
LTWNPGGTPILAQWQAAGSQEPDLLLWRIASARPGLAALAVVLALGLITGAILLLRGVILDGPRKKWALLLSSGLVLCALGLSAVVMQAGTYDPAYHLREFQPVCAYLRNNLRAADILIVQPYPGDAWQSLMNEECGQGSWYSLPYEDAPNSATLAQALVSSKIPSGTRYWLVRQTWTDAAAPDTASPLRGSDRLLQMKTFDAPYPVLVAAYQMGQP